MIKQCKNDCDKPDVHRFCRGWAEAQPGFPLGLMAPPVEFSVVYFVVAMSHHLDPLVYTRRGCIAISHEQSRIPRSRRGH